MSRQAPQWLRWLERSLGWIAVPNIAVIFVTLQALGFIMVFTDSAWLERLALIPQLVRQGELWRLVTFLSLPLSMSPIWVIFTLWFLYFIINGIESVWGSFKTTLYVLVSILVTIGFSLAFDYPVLSVKHFESTLFLAAAALFPELEVRLFLAIPVKIKWMAWLSLAFLAFEFARSPWVDRLFLLAIYSNFLLFFGPAWLDQGRSYLRRQKFKRSLR